MCGIGSYYISHTSSFTHFLTKLEPNDAPSQLMVGAFGLDECHGFDSRRSRITLRDSDVVTLVKGWNWNAHGVDREKPNEIKEKRQFRVANFPFLKTWNTSYYAHYKLLKCNSFRQN